MSITSAKRQQLPYLGSPSKKAMYIGSVQRTVVGRVIFLIMVWPSNGKRLCHFKI
ncbi:MAG: hypothetical protein QX197_16940 [Methylococcaceae bacterium]